MEIKELAQRLELKINDKLTVFTELATSVKSLEAQIDLHIKEMAHIWLDLEPVHAMVFLKNPQMETLGKDVIELAKKKTKKS